MGSCSADIGGNTCHQPALNDNAQFGNAIGTLLIDCPIKVDVEIETLSDFFAVFHSLLDPNRVFWFRGHDRADYKLAPSALRYSQLEDRDKALGLVNEMKRFMEMKLPRPPAPDDSLGWIQVAQHYGLPTRLLD